MTTGFEVQKRLENSQSNHTMTPITATGPSAAAGNQLHRNGDPNENFQVIATHDLRQNLIRMRVQYMEET